MVGGGGRLEELVAGGMAWVSIDNRATEKMRPKIRCSNGDLGICRGIGNVVMWGG